ncbi:MAG TPA: hypothetical protein DDW73_19625 [Rhizobium sp.]|jgi:toxin ParE1/3/4|nr:hypothetical protein [Rhizobium sp.]
MDCRGRFHGAPRDDILEGLRGFPYRDRCIYFRSYPDRVVVLRVMHSGQDVKPQDFGGNAFEADLNMVY